MDISRREFTKFGCRVILGAATGTAIIESIALGVHKKHLQRKNTTGKSITGVILSIPEKCIGCGRCANACKLENHVPFDEPVYRTWIERYR